MDSNNRQDGKISHTVDMIDKMKSDSLTHLDPARAAYLAMGGATVKVKWTSCICRMFRGDYHEIN